MRIALLIESAGAGAGRHVLDLADTLSQLGHSIDLVYNSVRADPMFRARLEGLAPRLTGTLGLRLAHWPHPADAYAVARLRAYLRRRGPFDILHFHSTKAGFLGRIGLCRFAAATVYTPHAPLSMSPSISAAARFAVRALEVALSRRTSAVIAVCQQEADHLIELGIAPAKVSVVRNGVPALSRREGVSSRMRLGIPDGDVAIGYVGRLEAQKRLDLLLHAVSKLPERVKDSVRLVIVGGGSLESKLRALSVALGLEGRVIWAGEVERAETYMPAFDIFALTSDYEALPYVLLEALASGLPIVTTRVGGATLAVKHDRNGFVLQPGDVSGLSGAIADLVMEPALRSRMAEASRVLSRQFSLDEMVRGTLKVYAKALGIVSLEQRRTATAIEVRTGS